MNKQDLVAAVTEYASKKRGSRVSKADAEAVLAGLGAVTASALLRGDDVPVPGIGRLIGKQRAARTGRNPRTGKPVTIPATRVVLLRVRKELKDALRG